MITRTALTKIFLQQWGKSIDDANIKIINALNESTKASNSNIFFAKIRGKKIIRFLTH